MLRSIRSHQEKRAWRWHEWGFSLVYSWTGGQEILHLCSLFLYSILIHEVLSLCAAALDWCYCASMFRVEHTPDPLYYDALLRTPVFPFFLFVSVFVSTFVFP
ncbi:hypothetical protein BDY21DRAFT_114902 [Lineolata rhizophorae]|uniref:Uncharacterized protein n=1 Tax=Lineolata rhizophorae TaxID=578093 RepID=A0A6A6NRI7_9PEZI|nr:hypothetical protein BDY21DRAFT_114902 [Lineolata rhizophorae]